MSRPEVAVPRVAVLLLNWNGWADTIECLESLFRLDYPASALTVVLCDNGSTDGSMARVREWARGADVKLPETPPALSAHSSPPVPKPVPFTELSRDEAERAIPDRRAPLMLIHNGGNLGFAGGVNVGLSYLTRSGIADYVWILNNDMVVAPDSLRTLVDYASSRPECGGVGATLFEYYEPETVQVAGGGVFVSWQGAPHHVTRATRTSDGYRLDYLCGGCMLSPTGALARTGLIAEDYYLYGEDVDYSLRIRRAGYSLAYVPEAHVWHKGGSAVTHRSPRHDYYMLRNNLYLIRRYYPLAMPVAVGYSLVRFVLPKIVRRQWSRLAALRAAFRDFRAGVTGPMPGRTNATVPEAK